MGIDSHKNSGEIRPISEGLKAIEASKKSVQAKLGSLWSKIKETVSSSAKEFMTKVEIVRPFSAHMNEVKKIIALKTYGKGSGDWREINKKLESLNITTRDIRRLQAHLKLVPDGKMGPRTIEGLTRLLGEMQKITLARKTTVDTERVEAIKKQEIAQMAPVQQPAPVAVLPAVPTNPNDAADATVDVETDDNSYVEEGGEVAEENTPIVNEGLLLSKEQAVTEAFKILTKGNLNSKNYNKGKREAWAKEIVAQMEATGISFTRQHILMIAVTIDRESCFKEIPVVNNPEAILDRKIAEEKKQHPLVYRALEGRIGEIRQKALAFMNARRKDNVEHGQYRVTSAGKKIGYFTERDIDLAIDYVLKEYENELSWSEQKLVSKEDIEKSRPSTLGAMQVSVSKAVELAAKYEHKQISERMMRDILNTREGGLKYGLYYMREVLASHEQQGPLDEKNIKFAFLDYNMGAFTARNAGIQANLNKLGAKLDVDGDLLRYDKSGKVLSEESSTEDAIQDILDDHEIDITDEQIRSDLLKEKTQNFVNTRTYREITGICRSKGYEMTKIIPTVKAKGSFVKTGSSNIGATGYVQGSYRRYKRLGSV